MFGARLHAHAVSTEPITMHGLRDAVRSSGLRPAGLFLDETSIQHQAGKPSSIQKKPSTAWNKVVDVQAAGLPASSCQLGLQGACARKEAKVSHSLMSKRSVGHLGEALKTENIKKMV